MSIRKKTMLIFGITLSCLIVLVYLISSSFLFESYASIEDAEITRNVERARDSLLFDTETMESVTNDWATWDDTYTFIVDANDTYRNSNLDTNTSWISNRLNMMFFVNSSGEIVYSNAFDLINQEFIPLPEGSEKIVAAASPMLSQGGSGGPSKGIVMLPEGPMIVTAAPILPSDKNGPSRGTLIWGRWLDASMVDNLAKTTHLSLGVQRLDENAGISADDAEAASSLAEEGQIAIRKPSDASITGYAITKDIYGNPALLLRVDTPRSVFAQGQRTMYYMIAFLIIAGLMIGLVTMLLLERMVIARMARLSTEVDSIGPGSDFKERVGISGNDEISHLANNINRMMATVQQSKSELQLFNDRLKNIMESVQAGIIIIDPGSHKIVDVNTLAASMIGARREEIIGSVCHKFICPAEEGKCPITDLHQAVDHSERVLLSAAGETYPILKSVTTIQLDGKDMLLESCIDISVRKQMEEQLKVSLEEKDILVKSLDELATHDGLTGLYNHRAFYGMLDDEVVRAQRFKRPVSLLMIDIDHFKRVNDVYGHLAGDAVLNGLAALLGRQVRAVDRVCRYGGEEFTVILPEADAGKAAETAERLRIAVEKYLFDSMTSEHARITVSIGVASLPTDADSVQTLVAAADAAMFTAKQAGRNRVESWVPNMLHP